jgi:polyisoprenoid-binding protein YceI
MRRPALLLLASALAAPLAVRASPEAFTASLGQSHIVVHVFKKGLLSGMAHDHHFVANDWRATARFDAAAPTEGQFDVVVSSASLRDAQPALSAKDAQKVNAQAADSIEARRYPEVTFKATGPVRAAAASALAPDAESIEAVLGGTMTLRGREHPVTVPVHASRRGAGWRARGSFRVKQSDFGIEPYSGFLGTIAVKDEIEIEFDLVMNPAS